jgi:Fur family ferric uptake transcriptional regulator
MQNSRENSIFISYLKENKLRITKQRVDIFNLLYRSDQPISIKDIISGLRNINYVTVYRNLESLEIIGVIHKIPTGFKYKYELSDKLRSHHHHIVCDKCAKSESISNEGLELKINAIAKKHKFKLNSHIFELRGVCEDCLRNG